ncbi:hypothetical protein niasHT_015750 [Heterodera trifolii]|uniref:Uncharacterized protein n=1 Tax=Heterodera trifolii TaxID=157864 RepID=A0ABD2L4J8_9BILA
MAMDVQALHQAEDKKGRRRSIIHSLSDSQLKGIGLAIPHSFFCHFSFPRHFLFPLPPTLSPFPFSYPQGMCDRQIKQEEERAQTLEDLGTNPLKLGHIRELEGVCSSLPPYSTMISRFSPFVLKVLKFLNIDELHQSAEICEQRETSERLNLESRPFIRRNGYSQSRTTDSGRTARNWPLLTTAVGDAK